LKAFWVNMKVCLGLINHYLGSRGGCKIQFLMHSEILLLNYCLILKEVKICVGWGQCLLSLAPKVFHINSPSISTISITASLGLPMIMKSGDVKVTLKCSSPSNALLLMIVISNVSVVSPVAKITSHDGVQI